MYTVKVNWVPGTFCKRNTPKEIVAYLLGRGWKKELSDSLFDTWDRWVFSKGDYKAMINYYNEPASEKAFEKIFG